MVFTGKNRDRAALLLSLALVYCVWKGLSAFMGSSIILPSPEETLAEALRLMAGGAFWRSLAATLLRGLAGFFISFTLGLALGFFAGRSAFFLAFLKPWLTIIRSTPVLAIILIALLWFKAESVPVFAAFLMAFPIVAQNAAEGVRSTDERLLEMARVYRVGKRRVFTALFLPSLLPYLASAASSALGLAWRVVVAAEVLSQPVFGVGAGMQEAKMRLETPRVFAWTGAALVLSWLTDKAFSRLLGLVRKRGAA